MLLLNSNTASVPQFVSLSMVLNADNNSDAEQDPRSSAVVPMVAPILLSGPHASVHPTQALEALAELQFHLHSTIQAATEVSADPHDQISMTFYKEDARQMEDVQLFSPSAASGLGLYYRLIRTDNKGIVGKIAQLILTANHQQGNSGSSDKPPPSLSSIDGIWGFLLCVGVAGLPLVTLPSDLFYHLSERVSDTKEILTRRAGDLDVNAVQTLLSTLLLYESDARLTNSRVETARLTTLHEPDDSLNKTKSGAGGLISPLGAALSSKRSSGKGLDGDGGGGPMNNDSVLTLDLTGEEKTRLMSERLKVLSVAESATLLQKYKQTAQERKAGLDLTGSNKGRFSRKSSRSGRDADLDNFDYKGPSRGGGSQGRSGVLAPPGPLGGASSHHSSQHSSKMQQSFGSQSSHSKGPAASAGGAGGGARQLRQPSKDTKLKAGMLSAPRGDGGTGRRNRPSSSTTHPDDLTTASSVSGSGGNQFDPFGPSMSGRNPTFAEEDVSTVQSQSRLQVNVALNEDLSCSYRSSQISSCTVEGVVQVQVRANAQPAPFYLFLRDPSEQVESFQENKKFADNLSSTLEEHDDADCKYTISVPNGDSYFPVVRYKCVDELRPVPIRVQTRAKTEGNSCRVALQISSNPNNEAKLTDLTIIMGVPEDISGESLVTQPAGGVWNDAKRCVTWCVEELAEGEKFQLQARFQMTPQGVSRYEEEKPMFPVLVRCQCLFAQLSDLELEIRDIPELYPADATLKIARRFRLSHRERA